MELTRIIDIANHIISDENIGHYVLHKSVEPCTMKSYKKFIYKLYLVNNKDKDLALALQHITQIPFNDIDIVWKYLDEKFLEQFLRWFKYGKLPNEPILDINN